MHVPTVQLFKMPITFNNFKHLTNKLAISIFFSIYTTTKI